MKNLKKMLRLLCLVFLMLIASMGVGFMGAIFPNNREKFQDNVVRIELVEKKEDEESEVKEIE